MPAADPLAASAGGESGPLLAPGRSSLGERRLVAALAVTQTIGFGVLYYSFSVLLTPMSRDLGADASRVLLAWSKVQTVAQPGALVQAHGWRQALIILALLYGMIAIPLHALVVRRPQEGRTTPSAPDRPAPASASSSASASARSETGERTALVRTATRQAAIWLLAAACTRHGTGVATISVLLITYLIHLGHSPMLAASVAGLLGVLSVTGRLITTGLQRRLPAALIAAAIFTLQAAAAALPLIGVSTAGAITAVLLFGLGFGVGTITVPHLLTERYGTTAYASLSGRAALPATLAKAVSPAAALASANAAGHGWVMAAVTLTCLIAAASLVGYHRLSFRRTSNHPSGSEAPA